MEYYTESRRKGISYIPTIKRKIDRFGHILRRDSLLTHVIQGMIKKVTGIREKRRK
jgi:hypothetical protein